MKSVESSDTSTIIKEGKTKKRTSYVSLRTVPFTLKQGSQKIVVNALVDDSSTKAYVNIDVAE